MTRSPLVKIDAPEILGQRNVGVGSGALSLRSCVTRACLKGGGVECLSCLSAVPWEMFKSPISPPAEGTAIGTMAAEAKGEYSGNQK